MPKVKRSYQPHRATANGTVRTTCAFSLHPETVAALTKAAARLHMSRSALVEQWIMEQLKLEGVGDGR